MKKIIILFLILAISGICFASDPAEGYWLSVDEKSGKVTGGWHIYQEDGKLLGRLLSSTEVARGVLASRCKDSYPGFPIPGKVSEMPVVGETPWIYGLTLNKPGEWVGGHIINPEDGKSYKCKIYFHAADGKKYKSDTLEMRGEIGLGIGRSQYWRSTDEEYAGSFIAN